MQQILRRRRALMANQWEDITSQLSFTSGTGVQRTITGNDIRVYTTSAGTNRQILAPFETSSLYTYQATCDRITVASGKGWMRTRKAPPEANYIDSSSIWEQDQGTTVFAFEHNDNIKRFALLCTGSTTEDGDVTFYNFRLWRRRL